MAYVPKDTPLANRRRATRLAKHEATTRDIHENPIRAQVVYCISGRVQGTVTPENDGSWTGCRYGTNYPNDTIENATEEAALHYVLDGKELGDGPRFPPALELMWKLQDEESDRIEAEIAARAARRKIRRRKIVD